MKAAEVQYIMMEMGYKLVKPFNTFEWSFPLKVQFRDSPVTAEERYQVMLELWEINEVERIYNNFVRTEKLEVLHTHSLFGLFTWTTKGPQPNSEKLKEHHEERLLWTEEMMRPSYVPEATESDEEGSYLK